MTRLLATILAILTLAGCNSTPALVKHIGEAHACAFMAGRWSSIHNTDQDQRVSEEYWLPFHPDGSIGINRLVMNGQTAFYEFLRIQSKDGETNYIAQPLGRTPGVAFTMIDYSDNRVVFENPDHDFPQRIVYERDGNELHASIEGTQNGKRRIETWRWLRAPDSFPNN